MPYLGIGSISGIIHAIARLPHAARAVVVVAVLLAIWPLNKGERGTAQLSARGACLLVRHMQITRCGRARELRLRR